MNFIIMVGLLDVCQKNESPYIGGLDMSSAGWFAGLCLHDYCRTVHLSKFAFQFLGQMLLPLPNVWGMLCVSAAIFKKHNRMHHDRESDHEMIKVGQRNKKFIRMLSDVRAG